ncbi:MAG: MFS transporter [Ruminococcaceae bacterium]|nr:MFS transporter [Oscillospiraceae bacterium]
MKAWRNNKVRHAIFLGMLCSISYLAVYVARNILSAVTPQILRDGTFTTEQIGRISSVYFICYAFGQLINGMIGDRIKARYMISGGLLFAGITNLIFSNIAANAMMATAVYGMTGFFLSMIYGPMTKVVAENTEPIYATRCSLGYTFASFIGSPAAGMLAAVLTWQSVFAVSSGILIVMAVLAFGFFLLFEKKGIVRYGQYRPMREPKEGSRARGQGIRVLIKHRIVKFSLVSILTGIVRTTVVFWLPTYISQYLGFSAERSAALFTAATLVIAFTAFISIFIYERLKRNMDLTILLMFSLSTVFFIGVYFIPYAYVNIVLIVLAIMSSNAAATMLWSRYCPSLRDTGMVSGATGFLDFLSYMAAAASSTLFSNAVGSIGWKNLILIWAGLVFCGVLVALPYRALRNRFGKQKDACADVQE